MLIAILFWTFFVSSILLIGWYGDFFARCFAAFLVSMTCLTFVLNITLGLDAAWHWVVLIDVAILLFALSGALINKSFWPIWFAGFQFNSVAAGFAQLLDSHGYLGYYANSASLWAIPALCTAVAGVLRDNMAGREQRTRSAA